MQRYQKQFKVIIERDEDGFFVAEVPALLGCYTQAKSLPELEKNLREVISMCRAEARASSAYRKQIEQFSYEPSFVGLQTITL